MEVARWQSQLVASLERRDAQQSGEMAELVESRVPSLWVLFRSLRSVFPPSPRSQAYEWRALCAR